MGSNPVREASVLDSNDPETTPIYCINLKRSTGRRERVTRRFAALDLLDRVQFIEGVDATSPLVQEHIDKFKIDEPEDKFTRDGLLRVTGRARLAVILSHLSAISTFVEQTPAVVASAIFFEDDVVLHREWHSRLRRIMGNLPASARVCALGYLPKSGFGSSMWLGVDPLERNLTPMMPGMDWGSQAYWISRQFALTILEEFEVLATNPNLSAERLMWRSDGFMAQPPLVIEEGLDSITKPNPVLIEREPWHRAWGVENYLVVDEDNGLFGRDPDEPPQTICLCMIVRDASEAIQRLADSVREVIDTWVICDTGSTDGTPERVLEAFADIPGELVFDEWQDFGSNRTRLIEWASDRADYLLLLDASHVLHMRGTLPRLESDAYSLLVDPPNSDSTPRLLRGNLPWRFVGAASEYLACDERVTQDVCPMLVVEHDPNTSPLARLVRDRQLLEKAFEKDPTDPHTSFYLAQACRDLGEDSRAIELYTHRIDLGGPAEEIFCAMLARAEVVSENDWKLGEKLLLESWEYRPERVEPLYLLLHGLRVRNQFELGARIGKRARKVRLPVDRLFVRRDLYDWMVEFEFSICALQIGDFKSARRSNERLLKKHGIPDDIRTQVVRNLETCLAALDHQWNDPGLC